MYRRILVAFDGSPESRLAVDECAHLITVSGREIHLACVVHDPSPYLLAGEFVPEPALAVDRSRMEADLKEAAGRLIERGFSVTTHLEDGEPVEVISKLCQSLGIDLLIVGPEGGLTDDETALAVARGARAVHLGSRILRADTAALAGLATLGGVAGDAR